MTDLRALLSSSGDGTLSYAYAICITCGALLHPDPADVHRDWHARTMTGDPG